MDQKRSKKTTLLIIVATMLMVFSITQTASADVKQTNVFKAWDRNSLSFENGNVDIFWDGGIVEVYSVLGFDTDTYTTVASDNSACAEGFNTPWGGRIELGFYHTDNNPSGAEGFDHTDSWDIVDCDFSGNGSYGNEDDTIYIGSGPGGMPPTSLPVDFTVITSDVPTGCSGGNCTNEIVTTMFVNLDADCNGTRDESLPTDVCFFAEAYTPTLGNPPYWFGPLQGRFSVVGGGDKTVNFNPYGPNAITLENLTARSDFSAFMIFGGVLVVLVASLIIAAAWRMRQDRKTI